ncbi:MAG TPA: hydroxymethylpyrimidine/phosphomethylpyrimidine kinase [Rhizobiaceae bacterium]|nr:hydroxymethylpyrimidine/phosphomethylpyrimidine kinase [Rhizobiaceae bacterium]
MGHFRDLTSAPEAEPCVLVVAGSDSSGGAGIVRDIETIGAFGLRSCLAVTGITVQTHSSVDRVEPAPPGLVAQQMRAAFAANSVEAVKIGMLGTGAAIAEAASVVKEYRHDRVVLDPVLASSSGRSLLADQAIASLLHDLMPLCRLVTPNLNELATLVGESPAGQQADARRQGERLARLIGTSVLVKGGHAEGDEAIDLLLQPGHKPVAIAAPRLPREMRGTGCMLSSAIAASLAGGATLEMSVRSAKRYVFDALLRS